MDCSLPGSFLLGIFQARILELVAISPGNLPDPGIEWGSPTLQAISLPSEPPRSPTQSRRPLKETFALLAVPLMHRGIQLCFSVLVLLVCISLTTVPTPKRVPAMPRQNSTHTHTVTRNCHGQKHFGWSVLVMPLFCKSHAIWLHLKIWESQKEWQWKEMFLFQNLCVPTAQSVTVGYVWHANIVPQGFPVWS